MQVVLTKLEVIVTPAVEGLLAFDSICQRDISLQMSVISSQAEIKISYSEYFNANGWHTDKGTAELKYKREPVILDEESAYQIALYQEGFFKQGTFPQGNARLYLISERHPHIAHIVPAPCAADLLKAPLQQVIGELSPESYSVFNTLTKNQQLRLNLSIPYRMDKMAFCEEIQEHLIRAKIANEKSSEHWMDSALKLANARWRVRMEQFYKQLGV